MGSVLPLNLSSIPKTYIVEGKNRLPQIVLTSTACHITRGHTSAPAYIHTHTLKRKWGGSGRKDQCSRSGEVQIASVKFVFRILQSTVPGRGAGYRIKPNTHPSFQYTETTKTDRCTRVEVSVLLGGHLGGDAKLNPLPLPEIKG